MSDPEGPGVNEPEGRKPPDGRDTSGGRDASPDEPGGRKRPDGRDAAPDGREASPGSGPDEPVEESPVPTRDERFGLNLGNPIESESAAFSWLIVVILAAISIGAVAKLVSPQASVIWAIILLAVVCVPIFRGLRHQLGSPDDDE